MNQPAARRVQPVPRPALMAEFRALLASGVLTDRGGAQLGAPCGCGGLTDGYTCPLSLRCPSCAEHAGRPCRRPSGHQAAETHVPRLRAAGSLDKARERDGDPTLPAPWPDHDPTDQILPKDRT